LRKPATKGDVDERRPLRRSGLLLLTPETDQLARHIEPELERWIVAMRLDDADERPLRGREIFLR
jgi:hypothetical protein